MSGYYEDGHTRTLTGHHLSVLSAQCNVFPTRYQTLQWTFGNQLNHLFVFSYVRLTKIGGPLFFWE